MLAKQWIKQDLAAFELVDECLAERSFTMDTVWARAFAFELDDIERIDRLITAAEARRNRVLNEIDYRREIARRMRKAIDYAEESELKTVNPKAITLQENTSIDDK